MRRVKDYFIGLAMGILVGGGLGYLSADRSSSVREEEKVQFSMHMEQQLKTTISDITLYDQLQSASLELEVYSALDRGLPRVAQELLRREFIQERTNLEAFRDQAPELGLSLEVKRSIDKMLWELEGSLYYPKLQLPKKLFVDEPSLYFEHVDLEKFIDSLKDQKRNLF